MLQPHKEDHIRTLSVGLIALVTLAAASLLLYRRRPGAARAGRKRTMVDPLYAAGL